jgi:hypothetical protein
VRYAVWIVWLLLDFDCVQLRCSLAILRLVCGSCGVGSLAISVSVLPGTALTSLLHLSLLINSLGACPGSL